MSSRTAIVFSSPPSLTVRGDTFRHQDTCDQSIELAEIDVARFDSRNDIRDVRAKLRGALVERERELHVAPRKIGPRSVDETERRMRDPQLEACTSHLGERVLEHIHALARVFVHRSRRRPGRWQRGIGRPKRFLQRLLLRKKTLFERDRLPQCAPRG